MRRFADSYFSYSYSSLQKSFTSICPLTESVSFRMPLISSLHSCDSLVRVQRVLPAFRVGIVNSGTMIRPTVARIQFLRYIAVIATIRVIAFERMLVNVFVITDSTPEISLVMRVMMSPWLFDVKNLCDICCRWRYMLLRMSKVICCAIQLFR